MIMVDGFLRVLYKNELFLIFQRNFLLYTYENNEMA